MYQPSISIARMVSRTFISQLYLKKTVPTMNNLLERSFFLAQVANRFKSSHPDHLFGFAIAKLCFAIGFANIFSGILERQGIRGSLQKYVPGGSYQPVRNPKNPENTGSSGHEKNKWPGSGR